MGLIAELASIVAPVFICAGLGLAWARLDRPFDARLLTKLLYNVGAPCLILATFAKVRLTPEALAETALAAFACFLAFAAIGAMVLKAARLELAAYLPSIMFPMTGGMGLPVCYFAFGEEGLAFALVYFIFGAVGTFTIGNAIAAGTMDLGKLARTPAIYAVALAVTFEVTGVEMPVWARNTTSLIGDMVIPAQLIALGVALSDLRVRGLARGLALSLLRLGMGGAVGSGVAGALGLTGAAWAIVILQSAMPVAVSTYLWAQLYGRRPDEVAGMVLISTVLSFATLPFLLALVLAGARAG